MFHLLVIQLLSGDVGGQQAVGAGVQQALDEGLFWGRGLQLKHLEGSCLDRHSILPHVQLHVT